MLQRKFATSIIPLCVILLIAASTGVTALLSPQPARAAELTESEPNNTAATADPIAVGDLYLAAIGSNSDEDWFRFDTTGGAAAFATFDVGGEEPFPDAVMTIYAADGTTLLAEDYDWPWHCYLLRYFAPGTYYVTISRSLWYSGLGSYRLTCTGGGLPPSANDVCAGAIDVQAQGLQSWTVDVSANGGFYDDYAPIYSAHSCLPAAPRGPEAVYAVSLAAGEQIVVRESGACDVSVWIATDCAHLADSCVAGADFLGAGAAETVAYTAPAAGVYFIVADTFNNPGCPVTVTIEAPVAVEGVAFGALKAMYR